MDNNKKNLTQMSSFYFFSIFSLAGFNQNVLADVVYKPSFLTPEQIKKENRWHLDPIRKDGLVRRDTNLWQHVRSDLYYPGSTRTKDCFGYIFSTSDKAEAAFWLKDRMTNIYNNLKEGYIYKIRLSSYAVIVKHIYPNIELRDPEEVALYVIFSGVK